MTVDAPGRRPRRRSTTTTSWSATRRTTTTRCRSWSPHAEGAWVTDVEGRRYLDCLAGYSALNFGHRHPALVAAAHRQLDRVTLTSRAFGNDQHRPVLRRARRSCSASEMVLPMNTGAEAVESGIKVARKWGYEVRGVPAGPGADRRRWPAGFHGRTTTIVGFSTDPDARGGFGPFTPGLRRRPVRRRRRAARPR